MMTDESVTNRNALKPVRCGCGGEASVVTCAFGNAKMVLCGRCGMRTVQTTETKAIEAWNRAMGNGDKTSPVERTAKVKTVEKPNVFKCGECGQYFHQTAWGSPVEYCSRCGAKLDWDEDIPMEYFESGGK